MVRYYIKNGISKLGPFSIDSLQSMAKANQLQAIDLLSIDGKSWIQARFVAGLFTGDSDVAGVITADFSNKAFKIYETIDFFMLLKFLVPACILMLLFGLFLGWINFTPDLKAIALVQETRDKLDVENSSLRESIRTIYFPKVDHQKEMDKVLSESQEITKKLQDELKNDKSKYDGAVLDFDTKLKKAVDEAKGFSKKLEVLEEAIMPFKELVDTVPAEPKLLELLIKLQKIPLGDRNGAVGDCLKALGELKGDEAQALKVDYKVGKNRFNESIAELIISWASCIECLHALSTIHKNTEACKSVMDDIRLGKDLVGKFMLDQFSDLKKSEIMKLKINISAVGEELKNKAIVALEKAQKNALKVLEFLKIESEANPMRIPRQGAQALALQKKAHELIQGIAFKTRDEIPVRLEVHALQLETLSEIVKELIFMKLADNQLGNDLKKYKFFVPFGEALRSKELRAEFFKKTYDKAGDMSSRKPEDLKKCLEAIAFNYQIVELSGLVSTK